MSHKKTTIDLSPGVTVIIGPNNCGKSAIVEALRCLSTNDLVGKEFIRHGSPFAKITVTTKEGDRIEWIREKTTSRHLLNGRDFGRLGRIVHEDVKTALKMPSIEGIDVHLSDQKDPVFLFNRKPSEIARFFASASDVDLLLRMQRNYSRKVIEMKRERDLLARNVEVAQSRVDTLSFVSDIELEIQEASLMHTSLEGVLQRRVKLSSLVSGLLDREDDVAELGQRSKALANLPAPPRLHDTSNLAGLTHKLNDKQSTVKSLATIQSSLGALVVPPNLKATETLRTSIERIRKGARFIAKRRARNEALAAMPEPPALQDTNALNRLVQQLNDRTVRLAKSQSRTRALQGLGQPPEIPSLDALTQLKENIGSVQKQRAVLEDRRSSLIAEMNAVKERLTEAAVGQKCPTCGGELKVDQLLGILS